MHEPECEFKVSSYNSDRACICNQLRHAYQRGIAAAGERVEVRIRDWDKFKEGTLMLNHYQREAIIAAARGDVTA